MNYDNDEIRKKEEEKERELAELIALGVLLFSDEEDEILRAIAAYLTVDDFNGDLNKWRSAHLAQANNVDRTVRGIISGYSQVQNEVVSAVINTAAVNAVNRVDAPLASAGVSAAGGAKNTASKAAHYFINQAKHDINTCNTVMRYKAKHGFVTAVNAAFFNAKQSERIWKALGEGALSVAEGRESLQSAVRKTIMQMAKDGIPAFIDKAGREWSPEAYVRMDLRTTAANTAREAAFERCAENDINLIEVDAHSGARPLCAPWQGRIYSLDGTSGTVKDGSGRQFDYIPLTSTSYGKAAGLFGINCGHRPYPFRPGVNFKTWQPLSSEEDFEKNSRLYKQFQKQRALERRIRADKRDCMMCEAAGDKKGFNENAKLLKRSRERYRAYCKATGLKEHNDRTQVYGFDRSVSAKAVWADRKAKISPAGLTSGGGSGTIKLSDSSDSYKPVDKDAIDKIKSFNIFGDERDNKVAEYMKQVLKEVTDKKPGTELLALYDYENLMPISKSLSAPGQGDIKRIECDIPFISIHNHASGGTFSFADLGIFYDQRKCKAIYVIGNNGNQYALIKTNDYNETGFFEKIMKRRMGFEVYMEDNELSFIKECEKYGIKYYEKCY